VTDRRYRKGETEREGGRAEKQREKRVKVRRR